MDVQGLVKAISTAFEDASKLVVRIRDQRVDTDQALPIDATGDLLESLELGRIAVKGQFDREHRRWAERYVMDDIHVREQLKDVLIVLQMQVVNALRKVYMDEIDVDFNALQDASDDCRVNAVVWLGQLSQRLSNQAKAEPVSMSQPQLSTTHQHSLPAPTPRSAFSHSPVDLRDPFNNLSLAPETPKQAAALPRTPDHDDVASLRRPSSATLSPDDFELLWPGSSAKPAHRLSVPLPGSDGLDRSSYVSSKTNNGNLSPPPPPLSPLSWTPQPQPREGPTVLKATQGFCKGAVRLFLQNGESHKAFSVAHRPVGINNMRPYWRCESCKFEGPATTQINTTSSSRRKRGKQENVFDNRIRVRAGGGVRFRWIFLAKSHCPLRSQVDTSTAAKAGEIGAFQCLFCLAEGSARGWTATTMTTSNGGADTPP
ncbi:hypothetical protein DV738_g88, partial [Chaetothyriales sp. CBS 135597]